MYLKNLDDFNKFSKIFINCINNYQLNIDITVSKIFLNHRRFCISQLPVISKNCK